MNEVDIYIYTYMYVCLFVYIYYIHMKCGCIYEIGLSTKFHLAWKMIHDEVGKLGGQAAKFHEVRF